MALTVTTLSTNNNLWLKRGSGDSHCHRLCLSHCLNLSQSLSVGTVYRSLGLILHIDPDGETTSHCVMLGYRRPPLDPPVGDIS